jgi:hypothetical protein
MEITTIFDPLLAKRVRKAKLPLIARKDFPKGEPHEDAQGHLAIFAVVTPGSLDAALDKAAGPHVKNRKRPCACGATGKSVTFGPDPFKYEINKDDTPLWMCAGCRAKSQEDI